MAESAAHTRGVRFTPADLTAAQKSVACYRSQYIVETLQRMVPPMASVLKGKVAFVPAVSTMSGDDLFVR